MLLDIDIRGALNFKARYPKNVIIVFIVPPNTKELKKRLLARGSQSQDELKTRLNSMMREYDSIRDCLGKDPSETIDYLLVNDSFEDASKRLCSIVNVERSRFTRLRPEYLNSLLSVEGVLEDE